ncbi:MAG: hypothetical protein K2N61_06640 [Lachnospiraceae bacterium]|nr:hypothetical protein [Lachnospiraceae bacterium]
MAAKCKLISHKAKDALETRDKQIMWSVLQEYIHKHSELFTMANGVQLRWVDADFYANVSEEKEFTQRKKTEEYAWLNHVSNNGNTLPVLLF